MVVAGNVASKKPGKKGRVGDRCKRVAAGVIDMPDVLRGKYQYHTCANTRRLRESGWSRPGHPLAAAVLDYVSNYLLPDRRLGDVPEP